MQTGTFYIASSIRNIPTVKSHAEDLKSHSLRWCNNYAWASYEEVIEQEGLLKDEIGGENTLVAMASRDIAGAVGASIFVLIMCPDYTMRGSFVELGARIGHYREAHVVLNDYKDMFFFHHPNIVLHKTWKDFMLAMFPNSGYIPSSIGMTD
jgi:hypothetical protein